MREAVIVASVRTAVGKANKGAFKLEDNLFVSVQARSADQ